MAECGCGHGVSAGLGASVVAAGANSAASTATSAIPGAADRSSDDVHALAARSVASAFSGQDRAGSGLLRYDQFRLALLDDLAFPLTDNECGVLAQCAHTSSS